jgi:hypothetical protein
MLVDWGFLVKATSGNRMAFLLPRLLFPLFFDSLFYGFHFMEVVLF